MSLANPTGEGNRRCLGGTSLISESSSVLALVGWVLSTKPRTSTFTAHVSLDRELRRFALLLRAEAALSRGAAGEAQEHLDAVPIYRTWYSVPRDLLSAHERCLRGRVFAARGKEEEALAWYGTVGLEWTKHAVAYIAPATLERARLFLLPRFVHLRRILVILISKPPPAPIWCLFWSHFLPGFAFGVCHGTKCG